MPKPGGIWNISSPEMSLVSIIIPAFQAARFIERALESVREQTHIEWEVIVIEDGSDDGTANLVREFASLVSQPVRYENNEANLGVSTSRNRALSLARGDFIAFLDADDWWTPQHLATGLATLRSGADICCSGFFLYEEPSGEVSGKLIPERSLFKDPLVSLFKSNFIQTSSLVILRKEVAQSCGGFDSNLKIGEDCDYWMAILSRGYRLACTEQVTCYYTKHATSAMSKSVIVAEHGVKFCRKHLRSEFLPESLRISGYAKSLWIYGRLIQRQDPHLALSLFWEAWQMRPLNFIYSAYALRAWVISLPQPS